jgi:hypothetical protein
MWPPPRYDVSTDAHCVSPGGTIQIGNFTTVYPDIASITQLDLVVLHTRWDPNQRDAGYQLGVWDRLAQPAFYPIREFRLTANGALIATLPVDVTREPPGGASIRMRYRSQSGQNREIDIEEQRSGRGVYGWGLFFVPLYKIYAATAEVGVGFNLFNHTVDGVFESGLPAGGWEEYCRIRYKNLSLGGFPGTVSFRDPNAWVQNPAQGYRVQMPATRTGSFDIVYQVVCPADRAPSGRSRFRGWALLGDYTLAAGQRWVRGMPPIESVDHP